MSGTETETTNGQRWGCAVCGIEGVAIAPSGTREGTDEAVFLAAQHALSCFAKKDGAPDVLVSNP